MADLKLSGLDEQFAEPLHCPDFSAVHATK
jgi:hypothetical protein